MSVLQPGGAPLPENCLEIWKKLGGLYQRPTEWPDAPIVMYAGTYDFGEDILNFVGDNYYNFAVVEYRPAKLRFFARTLAVWVRSYFGSKGVTNLDAVVGVEMGSVRFSDCMAEELAIAHSPYAEKSGKEVVFSRNTVEKGWRVLICEDVLNNFSTTQKLINLIESCGGTVVGIVGAMNRSPDGRVWFDNKGTQIPILSILFNPTPEYRQDDPYVADLIARGLLVKKPKAEWDKLAGF